MKVSSVSLVSKERVGQGTAFPYTHFYLDSSEQLKFNTFRVEHDKIKEFVREMNSKERGPLELRVNQIFAELISPYLSQHGMSVNTCFRTYGYEKDTLVTCHGFQLFDKKESFDLSYDITHWFSTSDENLSCRSHLTPSSSQIGNVLRDLVSMCLENIEADGITSPIICQYGAFINFASIEFALPIMQNIKGILEAIGKDKIEELKALNDEYLKRRSYEEEETPQSRAFQKAYTNLLANSLMESGLIRSNLRRVD